MQTITDRGEVFDVVSAITAYEAGEASSEGTLELFAHLIRTGAVWQLQGCYGRTAVQLLAAGLVDGDGNITDRGREACD